MKQDTLQFGIKWFKHVLKQAKGTKKKRVFIQLATDTFSFQCTYDRDVHKLDHMGAFKAQC